MAFVATKDLPRLRALAEVRRVFELQPVRLLLDKAIDYSLGMQTNVGDRRTAVYGPTLEFQPLGSSGHPEDPETRATDGFEGQGMIIAIIDTGVDWRHPMFGGTGQTTPAPLGWFIQDIGISSDDFHPVANLGPAAVSLQVNNRANGTYYYRVAGLFNTALGNAPGPYSETQCVTETIGVPLIVSITILNNHDALLNCLGAAGVKHRIQAGTNLVNWINLATNTAAADGTFQFEDTSAPSIRYRFYRLVTP